MMRVLTLVMAAASMLGACGSGGVVGQTDSSLSGTAGAGPSTSPSVDISPSSLPTRESTTTLADVGVTLVVSGWVGDDRRGKVLCPSEFTEACPGIPVTGKDLLVGDTVRVTGRYDGISLQAETVESWTPYERGELGNPCTGGVGSGSGGQSPALGSKVQDALAGHESRLAGLWLADGQLVVALTGPDDELAERIGAVDERVCVDTGYPSSLDELQTLTSDISRALMIDEAVWILDSWDSVADGRIRIRVEAIDTPTIERVADTFGDALDLTAYIEVVDAALADLPEQQPPGRADLDIPTAGTRGGISMYALTSVVLSLDTDAGCLFVDQDSDRMVVVWPFGYSAVSANPTIVYDPAGNEVARTGVRFDLGGGFADINRVVDPSQRCDAASVWQTAGPTRFEFETFWPQYFESEDN